MTSRLVLDASAAIGAVRLAPSAAEVLRLCAKLDPVPQIELDFEGLLLESPLAEKHENRFEALFSVDHVEHDLAGAPPAI